MDTEQPLDDSFSLSRLWRGAVDLFRAPRMLLRSMSPDGGYGKPIVYALIWQYVAGGVSLVVGYVRPLPSMGGLAGKAILFFFTPPLMILVGFFISAFLFVIWHLMGSARNYQTAFRVWALFAPLAVVGAIPYLNWFVMVYFLFLLATASIEVHGLRPVPAWTVWGILFALFILLVVTAGMVRAMRSGPPFGPGGFSGPGASPLPGFQGASPSFSQGMDPLALQKEFEANMANAKAEFERRTAGATLPTIPSKKEPSKR